MIFVRYPEVFCNHEPDFKKPIRISSSDLGRFVALTHNQNLFRLCWLFRRGCKVPSQTAEARLVCNRHALQTDELTAHKIEELAVLHDAIEAAILKVVEPGAIAAANRRRRAVTCSPKNQPRGGRGPDPKWTAPNLRPLGLEHQLDTSNYRI